MQCNSNTEKNSGFIFKSAKVVILQVRTLDLSGTFLVCLLKLGGLSDPHW